MTWKPVGLDRHGASFATTGFFEHRERPAVDHHLQDQSLRPTRSMARLAGVEPAARGFEVGDPVHPAASRSVRFRGVTVSATSPNVPTRPANHDRFAALVLHSPESASPAVLLSPREAAARLGVSRETIYRLCARGELRHVRVDSALRVDLGTYLAQLRPRP